MCRCQELDKTVLGKVEKWIPEIL